MVNAVCVDWQITGSDLFIAILAQCCMSILQFNPNLFDQTDPLMQ